MDKELERYYENRFLMFTTPGWKELIEDVQRMMDATNTLSGVTVDNLQFRQGEISIMRWLLSLQENTNSAFNELTEEK